MPRQITVASGMRVSGSTITNSSPPTRPMRMRPESMPMMRFANLLEYVVTGVVAVQIVDQLEAVQVQVGHGQRMIVVDPGHRALEKLVQGRAG